jgi:hypothetical protein
LYSLMLLNYILIYETFKVNSIDVN